MQLEPLVPELINVGRLWVDVETGLIYSPMSNTPAKSLGAMTRKGYLRICLNVSGRQAHALAHRIVWCAVNGPVPPGMQIDHMNGNKVDNRLVNLQCVTGRENMRLAAAAGLTNGGWHNGPRHPTTGRFLSKARAGRLLDGVIHDGYPEAARCAS